MSEVCDYKLWNATTCMSYDKSSPLHLKAFKSEKKKKKEKQIYKVVWN